MKQWKRFALLTIFLNGVIMLKAQHLSLLEGNLAPLKNETSIAVEFSYDSMSVGKYSKEQDYINKKTAELNAKEPGRGDAWAKGWVTDRSTHFEPKFVELFTKYGHLTIAKEAKYTLVFRTTATEPGFVGYGLVRKNADIDAQAWIVETADRTHVIAKISVEKAPGRGAMGYDYDTGLRLQEAYAMAGRALAKYLEK
jgi:hypothetical protein